MCTNAASHNIHFKRKFDNYLELFFIASFILAFGVIEMSIGVMTGFEFSENGWG